MRTERPPSGTPAARWHALPAARAAGAARVPLQVVHEGQAHRAGSVARAHLPALQRWPDALRVEGGALRLRVPADARQAFFAEANPWLRGEGLVRAWRDETYAVHSLDDGRLLATMERAASRFWGTLTYGAHCNGYVPDAGGRPAALWIARRSFTKPTDPGLLDNLVGGGVPHGQSPAEALVREGWEEAGLTPAQMRAVTPGHVLALARDIPEGFQLEHLSVFDLALPAHVVPRNQDGEVAELQLLPVDEALALAATDAMTVDAGLVTLDFALRHRLLPPARHDALQARLQPLQRGLARLA